MNIRNLKKTATCAKGFVEQMSFCLEQKCEGESGDDEDDELGCERDSQEAGEVNKEVNARDKMVRVGKSAL